MDPTAITAPAGVSIEDAAAVAAPSRCSARWHPACAAVEGGALLTLPASVLAGQCCCCRNDHGVLNQDPHA